MRKKIYEILDEYNITERVGCFFGIELELEGIYTYDICTHLWNEEHDHSLRDMGREYVIKKPSTLEQSKHALRSLGEAFHHYEMKPKETNLASTHIHINVGDMTRKQFIDFVALLMVFEVSIAKNAGLDRYNNYFALGTRESDHCLIELMKVGSDADLKRFLLRINQMDYRYSGINFASVTKFGSLELRFLGAKPNPMDVFPWLEFYQQLREMAMVGVDWTFLEVFSDGLIDIFIEQFKLPFDVVYEDILVGIRNAQNLSYNTFHTHLNYPDDLNGVDIFLYGD
ncbi:hypothetical protein NVP1262O_62 [Vibrio phage 1.262.O._10N.286.51.A9]|nr:hypothetical protein NVP1262O_62 [Vibrio phage 1.262.O._10N.286.51.A9]